MIARNVAELISASLQYSHSTKEWNLPVIAASVGAFANGTAIRCVQLANDRPVTIYRMTNNPPLVSLKMKCWKMMATTTQAGK